MNYIEEEGISNLYNFLPNKKTVWKKIEKSHVKMKIDWKHEASMSRRI